MLFFKSIELHGFKTFANKTTIDLFPGITVVVGPNGCGKSNVFDAIRWALGEQSAKSMRGSRMGDIIFNGSGNLKATGMARVNLVLNNANRTLPIDFDEVSVSRRLFRTGESEYLMNKSTCRLKDITNLFLDTGIGTDSYSIMEQGKVDAIINSKPIERRAIFDEAAGISKYKMKKDEALNKLKRTDEDLLRLTDIIAEVRRQANSLKRQAAKAERYKRLSGDLRALEMEMLVRRYFIFKESTAETEILYAQLLAQVGQMREELQKVDEEQLASRQTAEEVQQLLDDTQGLNFTLNTELQDATGRIALLRQRITSGDERRDELTNQIHAFEAQMYELDAANTQLEADIATHMENLDRLRGDYNTRKVGYDELKTDSDGVSAELTRLRQEITTLTRTRNDRDNESRVARAMEQKLADELGRSDAELGLLRQQIEVLSHEKDEAHSATEENDQLLEALKSDLATAKESVRSIDAEFVAAANDLDQSKRQLHETRSRHDALADLQESFEGYYRGVKEVMLAAKRKELHGVMGVVSTLIEANPQHELAIEVALGAQAQDIIVDRADNGKAAIQWLKQSRVGRATFLPLDLIEARPTSEHLRQVLGTPGVIGFATDLVKFNPQIATAVQFLLGNVIVCQSLDVAVALERRGFRTKFVTLDGDMVSSHGAMSGGSIKATGLLHRTREVKELAERMKQLQVRAETLEQTVAALREKLAAERERHEKLARSANAQEIETARTRKDYEVLQSKLSEKEASLANLDTRRAAMESEIAAHRTTHESGASLLEELTRSIESLESQLTQAEAQASAKQREVADFARELNDLMINISTGEERLSNLREKLANGQREKVRLAGAQTDKQREIETLKTQQEEAGAEILRLEGELEGLRQRQRELAEQITFENQRKETISLDLRRLGERSHVLQRDLNEGQNNLHEVELKRTEYNLQLSNITVQAQEKFNCTLEAVIAEVLRRGEPAPEPVAISEPVGDEPTGEVAEVLDVASGSDVEAEAEVINLAELVAPEWLRSLEELASLVNQLRSAIENLGPVHVGAIDEYNELNARYEFLTGQERDLVQAKTQLTETIQKIDETSKDIFSKAFQEIRANFEQVYRRLFGGGRADLILTEENGVLESGIDIIAQPPGKKPQHISLLSGGEKALTAVSLLFAIFMRKPSPFCILDEIDAPLDDKNIERFKDLVREFANTTQFIIITHNKQTMALANTIYGVTMEEQGVSRVVSLKLDEVDEAELLGQEAVPA